MEQNRKQQDATARSETAVAYGRSEPASSEPLRSESIVELEVRRKPSQALASTQVRTSKDAAAALRPIFAGCIVESLVVLHLDARLRVIGWQETARGASNVVHASPRDIFTGALLHGTHAIILAHNHPSGDPSPSDDDRALTEKVRAAGALLGVALLDHLVIGDERFYSFEEGYHGFQPVRS